MLTTIGLIIDIVIVLALIITGIIGFKKGFLKSILSLFSWIVCLVIAFFLAKYVLRFINNLYDFTALIGSKLKSPIVKTNDFFTKTVNSYANKDELLTEVNSLSLNGFLKQLVKIIFSNKSLNYTTCETTIGEITANGIGELCMLVIVTLLIFLILKLIVWLLTKFVDKLSKVKIVGGLNRTFGFVFGVAKTALVIFSFNCVLVILTLIPVVNKTITPLINENTYVEKVAYKGTSKVIEKYIVDGKIIQYWIENLWEAR